MTRDRAYRVLCGGVGGLLVVAGLALVVGFFGYHTARFRGADPPALLGALGPYAVYFAAFCGCGLVGWGGALLGSAREPARTVGTFSALALALAALYRIFAWVLGDYALFAGVLRSEAGLFLVLALAFVWLRPPRARRVAPEAA